MHMITTRIKMYKAAKMINLRAYFRALKNNVSSMYLKEQNLKKHYCLKWEILSPISG